jgi:hypothetical protein
MDDTISVEVMNPFGQMVFSVEEKISPTYLNREIALNNLADGIYFIEITSEKGLAKKKIIVAK